MPGVFDLEVEAPEAELKGLPGRINLMVADLVDDIADQAGQELIAHAPGGIPFLVEVHGVTALDPGIVKATAGVMPDPGAGERPQHHGFGSDPHDYPLFVDVGTGVFGEFGTPILAAPGTKMVIPPGGGYPGKTFAHEIKGQEGQHFSQRSFDATVGWVPTRIARMKLPSGGS